jgi:hypothetical protein
MDQSEVEHVAQMTAKATVDEVFVRIGINLEEDPRELQKDLAHLRYWRSTMEAIQRRGILAAVGTLVAGGLAVIWVGITSHFHAH